MAMVLKTAVAGLVLFGAGACTEKAPSPTTTSPMRIRGTAQSVGPDALAVRTYDGKTVTVSLGAGTRYAWVVGSSLSTLRKGDFIGTATSGPDTDMTAVELVIFPESMRGTGEGHYGWDTPAAANGDQDGSNAITNGTVVQSAMTNGTVEQSAMTNGTLSSSTGQPGGTRLTISYKGGTSQVLVPQGIPVVRLEPAAKTDLAKDQKLFVVASPGAGGKPTARSVAIGKDGLMPPM